MTGVDVDAVVVVAVVAVVVVVVVIAVIAVIVIAGVVDVAGVAEVAHMAMLSTIPRPFLAAAGVYVISSSETREYVVGLVMMTGTRSKRIHHPPDV